MAGGLNLYQYAGGNPAMFTDPFGLCPKARQDADGKCPGGLSVGQWDRIGRVANQDLTMRARDLVLDLRDAGKIEPQFSLFTRFANWVRQKPSTAVTNLITDNIQFGIGEMEDLSDGELAFVLAHEVGHTLQAPYRPITPDGKERDADAFACRNTGPYNRGRFASGSYPHLKGCD